jgi:hypothetical protein
MVGREVGSCSRVVPIDSTVMYYYPILKKKRIRILFFNNSSLQLIHFCFHRQEMENGNVRMRQQFASTPQPQSHY